MSSGPADNALLPATEAGLLRLLADVQAGGRQPSVVAAVVRRGQVVWSAARGDATGGPRPGLQLQYRIGSITKVLTAMAVLQCRDDGLLALDEPVAAYVPDAPLGDTPLRRLLSHSAGLPAEPEGPWWERHSAADLDPLFERTAQQRPVVAPGSQFHYSNLGFGVLGEAVAAVRGSSWYDTVQQRLLEPLGMARTSYLPTALFAQGYSVHPHSGRLHAEPHADTGDMAPAGQLWSTAADLARLAAFWATPDAGVLAPASVREMTTVHASQPGEADSGYGLGLRIQAAGGVTRVGHSGSMPGFLAGLVAEPATGLAAVAVANATAGATPGLPGALLDHLRRCEPEPAPVWRPEPVVAGADELVGTWFWGNTALTLQVRWGWLRLDHPGRPSRFERVGVDVWRGLDSYYDGELLRVMRDRAGRVERLVLATYELTRAPALTEPG